MFKTKKRKITEYLEAKKQEEYTAFDRLLAEYLSSVLKEKMQSFGIQKVDIYIDWSENGKQGDDYSKCIGIMGRFREYYVDSQIYPKEFFFTIDPDEPDETEFIPLESAEQYYTYIQATLDKIK